MARNLSKFAEGVKILVGLAKAASDPTLLSTAATGASTFLSLQRLLAKAKPSLGGLLQDLEGAANETFAVWQHGMTGTLPDKAPEIFLLMLTEGAPGSDDFMAERMRADALTELMITKAQQARDFGEFHNRQMLNLFRDIVTPTLDRLLKNKNFTDDLDPAFKKTVLAELFDARARQEQTLATLDDLSNSYGSLAKALDDTRTLHRFQQQAIATKFGLNDTDDLSDANLQKVLLLKADEYRANLQEIGAIRARHTDADNLKAAAHEAAERLDFDEVENLLLMVNAIEIEEAAETTVMRARNALMRGRGEQAYLLLSSAADSFAAVDAKARFEARMKYMEILCRHGMRYGGMGLKLGVNMTREALDSIQKKSGPQLWAQAHNNLAIALQSQGNRTGGAEGVALMAQSVEAFQEALRLRTESSDPELWAMTQSNLGNALRNQGSRTGGAVGVALLDQAVEALRAALRVYTEDRHPQDWAATQNNLATALLAQGIGSADRAALLAKCVEALHSALKVHTEAEHPVDWAMTQNNLGIALRHQGNRSGTEGAALLEQSVEACRAALRVRTEAEHPVDWARTHINLGNALRTQATNAASVAEAALLAQAVEAFRAALHVCTETAHPVDWAMTQNSLGKALHEQGKRFASAEATAHFVQANEAFDAALRVRTEAEHPVDWARTQVNFAKLHEAQAQHDSCEDPQSAMQSALQHVEAALRVFDPQHMTHNYQIATTLRLRILAAIGG